MTCTQRMVQVRLVLWLAVAGLLAAACGSQRSTEEFASIYASLQDEETTPAGPGVATGTGAVGEAGSADGPVAGEDGAGGAGGSAGSAGLGGASGTGTGDGSTEGGVGVGGGDSPAAGEPVRIGSVSTLSGPVGAAIGRGVRGLQAWVAATNANGGVDGHPIELFVADDGADPARHRSLVQEMVERRGVVAFVHNAAGLSGQSAVSYLEERGVPVIGSEGGSPWFLTSPMMFPQVPTDRVLGEATAAGVSSVGDSFGEDQLAILFCVEGQSCQTVADAPAYEAAGMNVVYNRPASLAQTSYSSHCQTAQDRGGQILLVMLDPQSVLRIADNCTAVGFQPRYAIPIQALGSIHLSKPDLDGAIVPSTTAPWFQESIPAVAEYMQAMSTFAPAVDSDGAVMMGWVSAKLFEAAMRATDDPTSPAGILQGLFAVDGDDLGGLTYPIRFQEGAPNHAASMQACWWDIRIRGGQFVSPDNGQRHCS